MQDQVPDNLHDLIDFANHERDKTLRNLREVTMLVDQSRGEVDKLAQRNAMMGNRIIQLEQNFDTVPRADIKITYEEAMDTQQRLFTMRGQLEKLEADMENQQRYAKLMESVLVGLGQASPDSLPDRAASASARATGTSILSGDSVAVIARIIDAQESERLRLSRNMHDGPAQSLTNFVLQAEIVQRLFDSDPERAREELQNLKAAATSTFQKVREFITELRPMMLDDLGLVPTLRRYVTSFGEKSGISTTFSVVGEERRMESHSETFVFRSLQELLDNARKHAEATSIRVTLDIDVNEAKLIVEDNGKGFDPSAVLSADVDTKAIGLPSMLERADLLGGALLVESAIGQGTRIILRIPTHA